MKTNVTAMIRKIILHSTLLLLLTFSGLSSFAQVFTGEYKILKLELSAAEMEELKASAEEQGMGSEVIFAAFEELMLKQLGDRRVQLTSDSITVFHSTAKELQAAVSWKDPMRFHYENPETGATIECEMNKNADTGHVYLSNSEHGVVMVLSQLH